MSLKSSLYKLTPSVPKRLLLLIACLIWGYAALRIIDLSISNFHDLKISKLWFFFLSFILYLPFFRFVFLKINRRHLKRILFNKSEYLCLFSFFDLKGYFIMIIMILTGLFFNKNQIIPEIPMKIFLFSLGLSLASSCLYFLFSTIFTDQIKNIFLTKFKELNL